MSSSLAATLPASLRAEAGHAASLGAHFALACLTRRFPVFRWHGAARSSGQPATLLVAGRDPWVGYLPRRFFRGEAQREWLADASIWTLPGLLRRLGTSADLTIARVDRVSGSLFFGSKYLCVPDWVGTRLRVPENPDAFFRSSENRREDRRVTRREGLRPILSHSEADFDLFYETMHVPYIRRRYGELAYVRSRAFLRRLFRRGGILWVEREGKRIAGVLFHVAHRTFYAVALGTADGGSEPRRRGALAAIYVYEIDCARERGCTLIDYGGSRPSLHDGALRYKRKWGITLNQKRGNYFDLLVRWNRLEGVVADFLKHTSLIFRDGEGLSAVHALDADWPATEADVSRARHTLWVAGLRRLYLFSAAGWDGGFELPPGVVRL